MRYSLTPLGRRIVEQNIGLAFTAARTYRHPGLHEDDALEAAFDGLMRAAAQFRPGGRAKFSYYAMVSMMRQIHRAAARVGAVSIPFGLTHRAGLKRARERARALGVEGTRGDYSAMASRAWRPISLEDLCLEGQGGLVDRRGEPPGGIEDDVAALRRALGRLSDRQRAIVSGLAAGATLLSMGEAFGVSKERVRQIRDEAYGKLRRFLEDAGVSP